RASIGTEQTWLAPDTCSDSSSVAARLGSECLVQSQARNRRQTARRLGTTRFGLPMRCCGNDDLVDRGVYTRISQSLGVFGNFSRLVPLVERQNYNDFSGNKLETGVERAIHCRGCCRFPLASGRVG